MSNVSNSDAELLKYIIDNGRRVCTDVKLQTRIKSEQSELEALYSEKKIKDLGMCQRHDCNVWIKSKRGHRGIRILC